MSTHLEYLVSDLTLTITRCLCVKKDVYAHVNLQVVCRRATRQAACGQQQTG